MSKKRKSQAAMEFLMTYGWAILVVLVVIVALAYFGILNPSKFLPETCTLMPGLSCTDFKVNTAGIAITVMNGYGKKFSTFSIKIEGEAGDPCVGEILTAVDGLDNGETETITAICSVAPTQNTRLKADLVINYQEAGGLSHSKTGSLITLVEKVHGSSSNPGTSCKNILESGFEEDGIYFIDPDGSGSFQVYCDMTTDGGGWTRIDFASDLPHINRWSTGDAWRWVPDNFQTVLSTTQIQAIQAVSTEGKQRYDGTCQGVLHWYYTSDLTYVYAFGFRFLNGDETNYGTSDLGVDFTIVEDSCKVNDGTFRHTIWDINDVRVPIINVYSRDNGNIGENFGSALTQNPAWLR